MDVQDLERQAAAFQAASILLAASTTGILAALCGEGPKETARIAADLGLDERAVATVCDALVCLDILERRGGELAVAPALRPALDPSSPTTAAHILEHHWHLLQRWSRLDEVLRSGAPAPRRRDDEPARQAFILGMADLARRSSHALWERIDLSARRRLVDVGGGPGEFAIAALERFPDLHATVLDLPPVLAIARAYTSGRAGHERLSFQPGDALTDPTPACDVALVFSVLHSYGPEDAGRIAANVAAGVDRGGLLIVREFLWESPRHDGPLSTALFAVNMLVGTSAGRCWEAAEIEALFGRHGFSGWRRVTVDPRSTFLIAERV